MNLQRLQRLWCVLVIIAFSSPVFAHPSHVAVVPGQIDSLDDINNVGGPNWVEVGTSQPGWGSYMEQEEDVNMEGTGSMKMDFTQFSSQVYRAEAFRAYDPNLDLTNWKNLAITLWVWVKDPNATRRGSYDSRLTTIVLTDSSFVEYDPGFTPYPYWEGNMGHFEVPPFKTAGWNKVIAPLRNFTWTDDPYLCEVGIFAGDCDGTGSTVNPNTGVDWEHITNIALFAKTTEVGDHNNAIYIDDMRFEEAPNQPARPYRLFSFDNIWDELWQEGHLSASLGGPNTIHYVLQTPPGDPNYREYGFMNFYDFALYVGNYIGDMNNFAGLTDIWLEEVDANNEYNLYTADNTGGSMMIDYESIPDVFGKKSDQEPYTALIPALDFDDGNDWAISVWVWSDLPRAYGVFSGDDPPIGDDSYLWEIILYDAGQNEGHYRVPRQDFDAGTGWAKVTARIDEFIWRRYAPTFPGAFANIPASQANLEAVTAIKLWNMDYPHFGNNIYLDDLWIEAAVEASSEAVVYDADYGTIDVNGEASDWDALTSHIIDFDLADPNIKGPDNGDLHVQYRLAWDLDYLYILVEEQTGDNLAYEATSRTNLAFGVLNTGGTFYDSLALSFDFTNSKLPSVDVHMACYLILGLSSTEQIDLMISYGDPTKGPQRRWTTYNDLIANGSVATGGTLGSRVIEAKLSWATLESEISSWFQPAGGFASAVQAGYIFGCDPHLQDLDGGDRFSPDATHGFAWFSGADNPIQWPQGNFRWPTGRDKYSTDIRLVD